jgi:flavin-dependent dehydrogenase
MDRYDALIIGAGPAGSVAARHLAKAGWNVLLAEKAAFPRHKVCGEFISAATLPLIEACGVGGDFFQMAGPPVERVALYAGRAMVEAKLPNGSGRALGRDRLDRLLKDAAIAAGANFVQAEAAPLCREQETHLCRVGAKEIAARLVIAACGSWGLRHDFLPAPPPKPSDLFAFKAHWQAGPLPRGLMPLLAFPGGYGGMVHADGGRMSLSCCIRRDRLTALRRARRGRAADIVFDHIINTTRGAALALDGAREDGATLCAGPIRPGIRPRAQDGIFFTGNLAGEAHPVIAEGISMAIQSSTLLARILTAEPDLAIAGRTYSRAWFGRFAPRLYASGLFAQMAMRAPSRLLAAGATARLPALLTWGAALAGKSA